MSNITAGAAVIGIVTVLANLLIIMPQRIGFIILVAIPAIAFVEGIAAFCTGWLDDGGRIVMGVHHLVGLGDNRLLRPQAAGIVGKGQAGIGGLRGGFRLHQVPSLRPIHGPAGTVEVANGIAADRCAGNSAGGRVIGLPLIGNGLVVELGQQVLPAVVAVGVGVGIVVPVVVGAIGLHLQQVPRRVIGIGIVQIFPNPPGRGQLSHAVIGIGIGCIIALGNGGNLSQVIVHIVVRQTAEQAGQPGILELTHLCGGFILFQVPVVVGLGINAIAHRGQPLQGIIAHAEGCAAALGGDTHQAAILFTIGKGFLIAGCSHLPALGLHPAVLIVFTMGFQEYLDPPLGLAVNHPAQGIVGVAVNQIVPGAAG